MRRAELRRTANGATGPGRRRYVAALCAFRFVVVRREASKCGGFLAADAAELRHADDEGYGGALAQAGNAQHQIETTGEIVIGA